MISNTIQQVSNNVLTLRWYYHHVKDIAWAPYKIKQNIKIEAPTVSSRGQTTYAYYAEQSRSPNHSQTTTEKVQFSVCEGRRIAYFQG